MCRDRSAAPRRCACFCFVSSSINPKMGMNVCTRVFFFSSIISTQITDNLICTEPHLGLQLAEQMELVVHRQLYDYKMYGDITLERLDVPLHTVTVNLTINVYSSPSNCPVKQVKVYGFPFEFTNLL